MLEVEVHQRDQEEEEDQEQQHIMEDQVVLGEIMVEIMELLLLTHTIQGVEEEQDQQVEMVVVRRQEQVEVVYHLQLQVQQLQGQVEEVEDIIQHKVQQEHLEMEVLGVEDEVQILKEKLTVIKVME